MEAINIEYVIRSINPPNTQFFDKNVIFFEGFITKTLTPIQGASLDELIKDALNKIYSEKYDLSEVSFNTPDSYYSWKVQYNLGIKTEHIYIYTENIKPANIKLLFG